MLTKPALAVYVTLDKLSKPSKSLKVSVDHSEKPAACKGRMVALTSGLSNEACKCSLHRMSRFHQQRGRAVFPRGSITVQPRFALLRRTLSPDESLGELTVTA